ncbi:shikimate kinase [Paraburkholderia xenovorans]|uniref:shikimate kinase n=1 Tax=Paraburkholderia xenovorans TaxID=36873 RepID=UPI0038BAED32
MMDLNEADVHAADAHPRVVHRICLVGLMGTGKSAVGQRLAKNLGIRFIDSDTLLESRTRRSVSELFALEGEAAFRKMEAVLIDEVSALPGIVLSTGGGAVLNSATREVLKSRTTVVHLTATVDALRRRIGDDSNRPLLQCGDPAHALRDLHEQRAALYAECAYWTIDTTDRSVCAIVADIVGRLDTLTACRQ